LDVQNKEHIQSVGSKRLDLKSAVLRDIAFDEAYGGTTSQTILTTLVIQPRRTD